MTTFSLQFVWIWRTKNNFSNLIPSSSQWNALQHLTFHQYCLQIRAASHPHSHKFVDSQFTHTDTPHSDGCDSQIWNVKNYLFNCATNRSIAFRFWSFVPKFIQKQNKIALKVSICELSAAKTKTDDIIHCVTVSLLDRTSHHTLTHWSWSAVRSYLNIMAHIDTFDCVCVCMCALRFLRLGICTAQIIIRPNKCQNIKSISSRRSSSTNWAEHFDDNDVKVQLMLRRKWEKREKIVVSVFVKFSIS